MQHAARWHADKRQAVPKGGGPPGKATQGSCPGKGQQHAGAVGALVCGLARFRELPVDWKT